MKTNMKIFTFLAVMFFALGATAGLAQAQMIGTATSVTCNSAILQGDVSINPPGTPTNVWFEWGTGTTAPFGNTTSQQTFTSSSAFSQPISGLSANTTYYYRAIASNSAFGTSYGATFSFITPAVCGQVNQNQGTIYYVGGSPSNAWGNMVFGNGSYNYGTYGTNYVYPPTCINCGGTTYTNTYGSQPVVNTYSPNAQGGYAVLNGYVDPNGNQNIVRWFEWGANQYSLSNKTNKINQSYAGTFSDTIINLVQNTTYYYRAAAQGNSGTTYGQVMSFTTGTNINLGGVNTGGAGIPQTTVVTSLPSSVNQTSARLNGLVRLDNNNASTNGWFEWGTTNLLGNTTETKNVGSSAYGTFNQDLNNLLNNTTYYYRAVAQNQYGTFRGDIVSFSTREPAVVVTQTVPTYTTIVKTAASSAKPSLVNLAINNDNEGICRGDFTTFTVNYTNISSQNLKDVVLRVALPIELAYQDTSRGVFSPTDNTVTVNIGALAPNESGVVVVKASVSSTPETDKALVTTANMVYTKTDGAQEEAVAYTLQKAQCVSTNAALALFGGSFFPTTLVGWLIFIIVILILIVLSRNLYGNYKVVKKGKEENK